MEVHMMHYEAISPVIGHALTVAVLALFALGVAFWLLVAFRIGRSIAQKRTTMESALLANATTSAQPTTHRKLKAS
jgi:FlaG/FlaF family flagellin (archaellin)